MDVLSLIKRELPKFFTEMGVPFLGKDAPTRSVMSGSSTDSIQSEKAALEAIITAGAAALPVGKAVQATFKAAQTAPRTAAAIAAAATGDPSALLSGPIGAADTLAALTGGKGAISNAEAMVVPARFTHSADEISRVLAQLRKGENPLDVYNSAKKSEDVGGVYLGPKDNKIKSVISDREATLSNRDAATLGDLLSHPKLFEKMPELAAVKTQKLPEDQMAAAIARGNVLRGGYNPATDTLFYNPNIPANVALSSILHETQHAVQKRGNFVGGSSVAASRAHPELNTEIANAMRGVPENAPDTQLDEILASVMYDLYKRNAGEAEARATQAMHRTGRYTNYPLESYDMTQDKLLMSAPAPAQQPTLSIPRP